MPTVEAFFAGVEATPFATAIRESTWMFPAIEVVHVLSLCLLFGSISMLDLRLLGRSPRRDVKEMARELLPWAWTAFAFAVASGVPMFCSGAAKYAGLPQFQAKLFLIALAGINMLVFHRVTWRGVDGWKVGATPPVGARLAGGLSLALWIGVIALGRWVGFA